MRRGPCARRSQVNRIVHSRGLQKCDVHVALEAARGSDVDVCLRGIGDELSDVLLVSKSRVVPTDDVLQGVGDHGGGGGDGGNEVEDGGGGGLEGGARSGDGERVIARWDDHGMHALSIHVGQGNDPKCDRCWRYVPVAAMVREGVVVGGVTHRVCNRCAAVIDGQQI